MNESDLGRLYADHIQVRQEKAEVALAETGFNALVLCSGKARQYYADDQEMPLRVTPHFAHWVPLEEPDAFILIRPSKKPLLVRVTPDDFWHEQVSIGNPFWLAAFEFIEVKTHTAATDELKRRMPDAKGAAALSNSFSGPQEIGIPHGSMNPDALVLLLDRDRSIKTPYEFACIAEANRIASPGFLAAHAAFLEGNDELRIHQAYLAAVGTTERDLPYETIVACDEKGAILHYQGKRRGLKGKSLLLDAGARFLGYCSDITRTWTRDDADPLFKDLVAGVEKLQQALCGEAKPGLPFADLQKSTHIKIGDLLHDLGILQAEGAKAAELKLTNAFFPHGVGHFLGIQVHDVGSARVKEGETLRNATVIAPGQVFTIEPGVYFNELLLTPHRSADTSGYFDWNLIDSMAPYGGVRIEDDVCVAGDDTRNLTREILAA